jgi:hypothetical protein
VELLAALVFVFGEPAWRQRSTELGLCSAADVGEQESLVVAAGLCERGRQALPSEHPCEHFVGDHLGVNQYTVAVEDHEILHGGGALYRPPGRTGTASDCDRGQLARA